MNSTKKPSATVYYSALRSYDKSEIICTEEWWLNDPDNVPNYIKRILHRLDGPAYIYYNINGKIKNSHWFINGNIIEMEIIEKLFGKKVSIPLTLEQQVELTLTVR